MLELQAKKILWTMTVSLAFIPAAIAQTQEQQATPMSTCRGAGCDGMSKAELFIKAFGGSKGLKTTELELNEEAKNAFYAIDATIVEVEKGRLSHEDGARIIENHKDRLRNIIDSKTTDLMFIAVGGQVSDIPAISKHLGALVGIARHDQFAGRERLAQHTQRQLMRIFNTFSQRFSDTCHEQKYSVETALALEHQNELMGTGISLERCLRRKASVELNSQGIRYRFESCNDLSHSKKWELKLSGNVVGEGKGENGSWAAEFLWKGIQTEMGGEMEIFDEEIEVKDEPLNIPNDAGPHARPNGRISAPVPNPLPRPERRLALKMRIAPLFIIANRAIQGNHKESWIEAEIKRDEPCSSVTQ